MAELAEYSEYQQKVIEDIIEKDRNFHSSIMVADLPLYNMLAENEDGQLVVKQNVISSLIAGSIEYNLQVRYSEENNKWFFVMKYDGGEIDGIVHYNTIYNPMGELAFAILNDNILDDDLSVSLPYSNLLILRK